MNYFLCKARERGSIRNARKKGVIRKDRERESATLFNIEAGRSWFMCCCVERERESKKVRWYRVCKGLSVHKENNLTLNILYFLTP